MTALHPATQAQNRAADPASSTWLSANAGSGKTRVLTDRVARLLLNGVDPGNILCLTYTKAAASEMQNRLFQRLGAWSMLADGELRGELQGLGVRDLGDLGDARTLFARAIETPGGLKIQTIHSFCAALLRQFPLEAGVALGFTEMDDSAQSHLIADVLDALADGDQGDVVAGIARHVSGDDLIDLAKEVAKTRTSFETPLTRQKALALYDLPPNADWADIAAALADADASQVLADAVPILRMGSSNDEKLGLKLAPLARATLGAAHLPVLEGAFLTGKNTKTPFGSKAGKIPTKKTREAHPALFQRLDALMDTVETLRPLRLGLAAAEKTLALHAFAQAFLPAYEDAKSARGWLDFDDLILRSTALLSDPSVAAWVLYRLDGGIDHVLVDESQDTSPAQWRIIELLTQERGTGEGARADVPRTLFVVGDKKQSIYSFQGADAEAFDRTQARFADRLRAEGGLQSLNLRHSFRSSTAVLEAVDATFEGVPGLGDDTRHVAFRDEMPGRVDLWPIVPKAAAVDDGDWTDPVDQPAPNAPANVLADMIADEIRQLIDAGTMIPHPKDGPRPMTEGDVLILVQTREGADALFHRIIRACKAAGLAVAGADRLKIGGELAVRDLAALLASLALPEDSLSLAASLRSPLFGWSEQELYALAAGRDEPFLWETLRKAKDAHPDTWDMLQDLARAADFLRPYDLLERILIRHRGRSRLIARLGPEAEDGIDELLNQALQYEAQETPSLTGFLAWLDGEDVEVKRQLEAAGGKIRVMTVHGAKGLEAPVVILPDTLRTRANERDKILSDPSGVAHWRPRADDTPDTLAPVRAQVQEADRQERQRLLYVAMTRAQSWLIVCGAGDDNPSDGTWYRTVEAGLSRLETTQLDAPSGPGRRHQRADWPAAEYRDATGSDTPPATLPPSATTAAPPPEPTPKTLSPSDLGGAKALPGDPGRSEEDALARGRQIHLLLEHLPAVAPTLRHETGEALLSFGEDAIPADAAYALTDEVSQLLDAPHLSHLFAPDALAEAHITATLPELDNRRIHGAIDRLLVDEARVLCVDFKSNAIVPTTPNDVPDGLLRQMGAYTAALTQIYPDHRIELAILWTATATLMPLPNDIVMKALGETTIS
ncbi:MAG: double-strand break repair helicase AddA [Pseudomonadota bacterium]